MQDRLIEAWRTRPRLIVGCGLGGLALVTLGAFAMNGSGPRSSPVGGRGLDIAVVAPVEPDIQPGSRMEVGALVDDFDTKALQAANEAARDTQTDDYYAQPAYVEDPYETYGSRPRVKPAAVDQGYSQDEDWKTVPGRGDRMGLGFDAGRPETGAEREARREARQFAREAARDAARDAHRNRPMNSTRVYSSRPSGDPDATFY